MLRFALSRKPQFCLHSLNINIHAMFNASQLECVWVSRIPEKETKWEGDAWEGSRRPRWHFPPFSGTSRISYFSLFHGLMVTSVDDWVAVENTVCIYTCNAYHRRLCSPPVIEAKDLQWAGVIYYADIEWAFHVLFIDSCTFNRGWWKNVRIQHLNASRL